VGGIPGREINILIINEGDNVINFNNLIVGIDYEISYKSTSFSESKTLLKVKFAKGQYYCYNSLIYEELLSGGSYNSRSTYSDQLDLHFSSSGTTVGLTKLEDGLAYTYINGIVPTSVSLSALDPIN
jgi:hypothetical protein